MHYKNEPLSDYVARALKSKLSHPSKPSLSLSDLTEEQQRMMDRLYEHDATLLIAAKGSGKQAVAQFTLQEMIESGHVERGLVILPPKVGHLTWANEPYKWVEMWPTGLALGDADQRAGVIESNEHRIVVLSADSVAWFVQRYGREHGFDGLVIDECGRFKSPGAKSVKALRRIASTFKWRVGMSATPLTEHPKGVYAQALLLDDGAALGTRYDRFLAQYFIADWSGYKHELMPGADRRLAHALRDLVYVADTATYQQELVDLDDDIELVEMPSDAFAHYEELAQTMVMELTDTEAANSAVLAGKLAQVANGFIYDEHKTAHLIHSAKRQRLQEMVSALDEPVVVVYNYIADLEWLKATYPHARVLADDPQGAQDAWNAREVDMLLVHPRSAGMGLNLQYGGRYMIQMGPIWSADQTNQVVGRLLRRGQAQTVIRRIIVCENTVDRVMLGRLDEKYQTEGSVMAHLKRITNT